MSEICIPYGAYWSTPFSKWQGSMAHLHSIEFAAHVGRQTLASKNIPLDVFDYGVLGMSVPQRACFYGLPWLTGMMGAGHVGGPTISQACATSARVMATAYAEIQMQAASCVLTICADRISNGPHLYYPNPNGPGGTGRAEDWVMDNFAGDPYAHCDMTTTAENCAEKWKISTQEQHELVLRRYQQYQDAIKMEGDKNFQQRYMSLPFDVPDSRYRKTLTTLHGDEGVTESTAAGLAKLKPVKEGGTVTFGGQTHPADGSAGMVITTPDKAKELSAKPEIKISIESFGQSRVDMAYMPSAPVPATKRALQAANISIEDITAIKSHNPFAVNDIIFSREMGVDVMSMNNYGCSLIWGHPQGPTGMRSIIELIEELVIKGGGYGLFQGCAAGDTAMAVVIRVS
ncbi:MAG: acetyl-CoA acetyltransferase family protein [Gammaproteobacteria bacterium]|jgi:acetyl-CoA acetyltransferase family protein